MTTSVSPAGIKPQRVLAVSCLSLLVVGMDMIIVNVALPAGARDLHASMTGLQWILDAYTLALASLLMAADATTIFAACMSLAVATSAWVPSGSSSRAADLVHTAASCF